MKICFPVQGNEGMESRVYNHFGSAPVFVVVDIEANSLAVIVNRDQHHEHGACNPIRALDSNKVDAVVVGGIGAGALGKLNQAGIRVFRAGAPSIKENLSMLMNMQLPEYTLQQCCGGHSHGGGCAH
ncbi:MAG TPA: NifB/NifX family molybdenum-iron cluster-binding protein [Dissulfurispiraceae bacterium]